MVIIVLLVVEYMGFRYVSLITGLILSEVIVCTNLSRPAQRTGSFNESDGEYSSDDYDHVVTIPDVHGDVLVLLRSLAIAWEQIDGFKGTEETFSRVLTAFSKAVKMVDGEVYEDPPLSSNPRTLVVQLGDMLDRGDCSYLAVWALDKVSVVFGWKVSRLFGNHELSALHPSSCTRFRELNPDDQFTKALAETAFRHNQGELYQLMSNNYFGMVRFGDSKSRLNRDDARNPNTLFVHAGFFVRGPDDNKSSGPLHWFHHDTDLDTPNVANFNQAMRRAMACADPRVTSEWLNICSRKDSVFWTRSFHKSSEDVLCGEDLDAVLRFFKVARIIVGHSGMASKRVLSRCNGKVVMADVRLSRWMDPARKEGQPMALIMTMDDQTRRLRSLVAHYSDLRGRHYFSEPLIEFSDWQFPENPSINMDRKIGSPTFPETRFRPALGNSFDSFDSPRSSTSRRAFFKPFSLSPIEADVRDFTMTPLIVQGEHNIVREGTQVTNSDLLLFTQVDNPNKIDTADVLVPMADPIISNFQDVMVAKCSLDNVVGMAQLMLEPPGFGDEHTPPLRSILETIVENPVYGVAKPSSWGITPVTGVNYLLLQTSCEYPMPSFDPTDVFLHDAVLGVVDGLHNLGILVGLEPPRKIITEVMTRAGSGEEADQMELQLKKDWVIHFFATNTMHSKVELVVFNHMQFAFDMDALIREKDFVASLFHTHNQTPRSSGSIDLDALEQSRSSFLDDEYFPF